MRCEIIILQNQLNETGSVRKIKYDELDKMVSKFNVENDQDIIK